MIQDLDRLREYVRIACPEETLPEARTALLTSIEELSYLRDTQHLRTQLMEEQELRAVLHTRIENLVLVALHLGDCIEKCLPFVPITSQVQLVHMLVNLRKNFT